MEKAIEYHEQAFFISKQLKSPYAEHAQKLLVAWDKDSQDRFLVDWLTGVYERDKRIDGSKSLHNKNLLY